MEGLYNALEVITVDGDLCRGTEMDVDVVDDVLCFFVNYDMYVYKNKEETLMENIKHNTTEKG
jgi:hypothetical protein